ncbi:MAG: M23 family metallopeptidase [Lachnospiraceae bacterium]|nr:M23 family metallopeptidase [Lachnospiraceae bacterium]
MKKRKRGISRYTVMFIPDTTDDTKSYELTFDRLARWIALFFALIAIVVCLFISVIIRNQREIYGENGYVEQLSALKEENESLRRELAGGATGQKAEGTPENGEEETQEIPQTEDMPSILPVRGTATIVKDPTKQASRYPDRLVLLALKDSEVIAAADGVVEEVYYYEPSDNDYRVAVMVDHRNGYETVYLVSGDPEVKVQKGTRLKKEDLLAEIREDETIVGYDILYGGSSLDPAKLLNGGS